MGLLAHFHFWPLSGRRPSRQPCWLPTNKPVQEIPAESKALFLPDFFDRAEVALGSPEALKEPALQLQRSVIATYAERGNDNDWPIELRLLLHRYMAEVECLRDKADPPLSAELSGRVIGAYWDLQIALS